MGQGPSRRDDDSDEYESRHRGVDTSDAQEDVDEAIRRVRERFGEADVDAEDAGRATGDAAGGFAGGTAGGLAGSAVGSAVGREAGGRAGRRYAAAQANVGPSSITDVRGIGEGKAEALRDAGYESIEDLQDATHDELESVEGIGPTASGRLKQTASTAGDDSESGTLDPSIRETIEQTPFDASVTGQTAQARQDIKAATAEATQLYQSTATEFASQTRNKAIARAMSEQIENGVFEPATNPSYLPTSVGPNQTGEITLPATAATDDINHELGHAVSDAFGYGRGRASVEAENEYGRRLMHGESDPFIANDPDNSEFWLTQENGEHVDDVPEEFATLMDETNRAWQRIQRHYQSGGVDEAENYTIRDNYSSTGASEVFAQLTEVMQSNAPDVNDHLLDNQPDLVAAYRECFSPSDTIRDWIDRHEEQEESDRERP